MLCLASQNSADFYALNAGFLDFLCDVARDVFVYVADDFSCNRVDYALNREVTFNALCKRLEDFLTIFECRVVNTVDCSAVFFIYNYVLSTVYQRRVM